MTKVRDKNCKDADCKAKNVESASAPNYRQGALSSRKAWKRSFSWNHTVLIRYCRPATTSD